MKRNYESRYFQKGRVPTITPNSVCVCRPAVKRNLKSVCFTAEQGLEFVTELKTKGKHQLLDKTNIALKNFAQIYRNWNLSAQNGYAGEVTCMWWLLKWLTSLFFIQLHSESLSLGCFMCSIFECFVGLVVWRLAYS